MERMKTMQRKSVKTKKQKITFSLEAPEAQEVHLVGEFNDWENGVHRMKTDGKGVWVRSVMLQPGTFEYKFWVDGQWVADPRNERVCLNCFGTTNSIVRVVES